MQKSFRIKKIDFNFHDPQIERDREQGSLCCARLLKGQFFL